MAGRPIIVLGAGGHAKVVIDLLLKLGRSALAAVEQTEPPEDRRILNVPVHAEEIVLRYAPDEIELALGVGMPGENSIAGLAARRALGGRYRERGYIFPPLAHPSAIVATGCRIGAGAQVMAGAILQADCVVESFAIINTAARVDHDSVVGEGSHVAPGATLGGSVHVGRETLIGIGASIRQGVLVGNKVLIAGGAMVVDNVPDGESRAGVPARVWP
jgi:UDP-perosamine 4-acetyltransferase